MTLDEQRPENTRTYTHARAPSLAHQHWRLCTAKMAAGILCMHVTMYDSPPLSLSHTHKHTSAPAPLRYVSMGKSYAYIATSLIYVFVFFAVIFGIFGLVLTLLLCRPNPDDGSDVSRMGCCMTQTSWCSSSCSIVLLAFLGIIFYILSIAIGDTCYTIDNIPKVGFNAYFGKIIPPMGGMEPVKIMDACWQGKDVLPILGIEVPKNVSGSFDTSKIDSLDVDFKMGDDWDTYKASIEKAGAADTKAAVTAIDDKISEIKTAGVKLKKDVPATVNTAFTSVDTALTAATTAVSDCGFIADIYRSFSSALCQDGLEGLLWMTLATLIVAWCCFPMIITSILINIRNSGLGQKGTILHSGHAPRPGMEDGTRGNPST